MGALGLRVEGYQLDGGACCCNSLEEAEVRRMLLAVMADIEGLHVVDRIRQCPCLVPWMDDLRVTVLGYPTQHLNRKILR
jgi:hypothetical protein